MPRFTSKINGKIAKLVSRSRNELQQSGDQRLSLGAPMIEAGTSLPVEAPPTASGKITITESETAEQSISEGPPQITAVFSGPVDLWERALEALRRKDGQLVQSFEKCLSEDVADTGVEASDTTLILSSKMDREEKLSSYIKHRINIDEESTWKLVLGSRTIALKEQVDMAIKVINFAKDFVARAPSSDPYASWAWSGVCLLLPLLLNPSTAAKALSDGLGVIATIIDRFKAVDAVYRPMNTWADRTDDISTDAFQLFEKALIGLYSKVLEYEARAACKFYQHRFKQIWKDMVKIENLDSLLHDITIANSDCEKHLRILESIVLTQERTNRDERHETIIGAFQSTIQVLTDTQHTETRRDQREQEDACLRALRGKLKYENNKIRLPTAMANTCRWVLDDDRFLDWRNGKTPGLLWISASPGCGKSVLSKSIADTLSVGQPKQIVCYFFFKHDSHRKTSHALRALLHQAFSANQALVKHALPYFRINGKQLARLSHTLWNILIKVAQDPGVDELVCVLDALDECQNPKKIIAMLVEYFSPACSRDNQHAPRKLKFFLTGRPNTSLQQGEKSLGDLLRSRPDIHISGDEVDKAKIIQDEITLYIKDQTSLISEQLSLNGKTTAYLENKLLSMQNRTYLWLYLVLDVLRASNLGTTQESLEKAINKLPATLDAAYEAILRNSPDPVVARRLLHVIIGAKRPLSVVEMRILLAINNRSHTFAGLGLDDLERFEILIRSSCGHFIMITEGIVSLIHKTAKEFLIRVGDMSANADGTREHLPPPWKHSIIPSESHLILAQACIRYLCFSEFESESEKKAPNRIVGNEEACNSQESVTTYHPNYWEADKIEIRRKKHEFLDYASSHWVYHHNLAGADVGSLKDTFFWRLCDPNSAFCRNWFELVNHQNLEISVFEMNKIAPKKQDSTFLFCCFIGLAFGVKTLAKNTSTDIKIGAIEFAIEGASNNIFHLIDPSGSLEIDSNLFQLYPNSSGLKGVTPLRLAVHKRNLHLVKILLELGADPNYLESQDQTPILHQALKLGEEKTFPMVKILLKNGADVNALATKFWGPTPLCYALNNRLSKDVCDLLRGAGAESRNVEDPELEYLLEDLRLKYAA